MNHHLNEIKKESDIMDESGLGDDVSADETIAFWIVVIIALAFFCAFVYGVIDWKVWYDNQ